MFSIQKMRNGIDVVPASRISVRPLLWLWLHWLVVGKLHILAGPPGTGKTNVAIAFAAALSNGGTGRGRWPDGTLAPFGRVLFWTGEDDLAEVIRPRLEAAGANCDHVHLLRGVDEHGRKRAFDFQRDLPLLRAKIEEIGGVVLVVIDSIIQAVAGDSNKNSKVRRALEPLVQMAEEQGFAILGLTHVSKGSARRDPVERVTGSLAFAAVARVVMLTAKSEADGFGDGQPHCVLVRAKSNLGPGDGGFDYRVQQADLMIGTNLVQSSQVEWNPTPVSGPASEILKRAEGGAQGGKTSQLNEAKKFLAGLLENGPLPRSVVEEEASKNGIAWATLRRAQNALGIEPYKQRGVGSASPSMWSLPDAHHLGRDHQDGTGYQAHVEPPQMQYKPPSPFSPSGFGPDGGQAMNGFHPVGGMHPPFAASLSIPPRARVDRFWHQTPSQGNQPFDGQLCQQTERRVGQVEQPEHREHPEQVERVERVEQQAHAVTEQVWNWAVAECNREYQALLKQGRDENWGDLRADAVDSALSPLTDLDESQFVRLKTELLAAPLWGQ
ncbi:AAA family ATPase [Ralstonia pseudosolanacearum]|uniref:AAA family ATPase n=1 Tax=Ralstonia pseudosolanacearum TaxID=1310165 RepID=UPI001300C39E|nr:AAA family ATPase [Ralstonia pseudosolanacearum]MCK4125255.1 AAA family ATPase [Ralstonia pseudosolanacearum]